MPPTSEKKPKQFSFTLSDHEHQALQELAESENRSAANWLRNIIGAQHYQLMKQRALNEGAARAAARALAETKKGRTRYVQADIVALNEIVRKSRR